MSNKTDSFGQRFGALVKQEREKRGWSQGNLAARIFPNDDKADLTRKADVSKIEAGQSAKPRAATIKRYCDALDIDQATVDALRSPDQMPTVTQMRRLLAERDHLQTGKDLSELQVIGLAERVAETVPDFDTALRELDQALSIAEKMEPRPGESSSFKDPLDSVFAKIQRLNETDDTESALSFLKNELKKLEHQKSQLLDWLAAQEMLRLNAKGVVEALTSKVALQSDRNRAFSEIQTIQTYYLEKYVEGQSSIVADISIRLAETMIDFAPDAKRKEIAICNLSETLNTFGNYGESQFRTMQAIAAYRSTLKILLRSRRPMQWATTQNNLGIALSTLGAREEGTARLEQAVTTFEAALEVYTKDAMPVDWAMTQGNLCNVELAFFDNTGAPKHLDRAQHHLDNAVEVFTRAEASHYLSMAANQQAEIDARRAG